MTPLTLDQEELETIEEIAKSGMSGRVTAYEIVELVRVYREALKAVAVHTLEKLEG